MKTLLVTAPETKPEPRTIRDLVPDDFSGWRIEALPSGSLGQTVTIPDITVVQLNERTRPAQLKSMIPQLAHLQARFPQGSYVVFTLKRQAQIALHNVKTHQRRMQALLNEINHGLAEFPHPDRVDISLVQHGDELAAKLILIEAKLNIAPPRPSPLDQVKQVVESTQDLRVVSGNISAENVAKAYGISLSELANWLGKSRQAVNKTPDADSLQPALSFFERVARLRLAIKTDADFRKWLRTPQELLENKSPLQLMAKGEWQVMADFVDDALTGAPT